MDVDIVRDPGEPIDADDSRIDAFSAEYESRTEAELVERFFSFRVEVENERSNMGDTEQESDDYNGKRVTAFISQH